MAMPHIELTEESRPSTAASPWPGAECSRVLFILDACHAVDRALLEQWLEQGRPHSSFAGEVDSVALAISTQPEDVNADALARALDRAPETLIVPLRVVWLTSVDDKNTSPRLRDLLFGNPRRPGYWRARAILRGNPERARCIAGASATLGELRQKLHGTGADEPDSRQLADFIAEMAALALDIAERRLQGSRYKVPRQVARNLQSSPRFISALGELSRELDRPIDALQTESAAIMKELSGTSSTFWLDVMARLSQHILSLGYESEIVTDRARLESIRQRVRENPAAFLWTHKTYLDGFVVNSVLFNNDFPAPHSLGGVNMAFAGFGYLLRHSGGIFIRRSFKDQPLYKLVLRHYIGYLMNKRFPLTWSFEGTRSRLGKLMPPRYGLLKYVVEAAEAADAQNLHVIPICIAYDLIGDVTEYAREQSGIEKKPESLGWFLGYLKGLRQPMGRIYVEFGEPIVLEQVPSVEDPLVLSKIAFQVGVEANRVTPVTLPALGAMVLLGAAPRALTGDELRREILRHVDWLTNRDIRLTSHFDKNNTSKLLALWEVMLNNGLLSRYEEGPETLYTIAADQHVAASYYRNTIAHFFVNKAIIELVLVRMSDIGSTGEEEFWREAERLRNLFKYEFFYAPSGEFENEIREELCRYDVDWQKQLAQTGGAAGLLDALHPLVAHATLLQFVEAYLIVSDVLAQQEATVSPDEKLCVKRAMAYGKRAYLQRRISSEASINKLLFQNGYNLLANMGLTEAGNSEVAARRRVARQDFSDLLLRLEDIRSAAYKAVMKRY